MKNTEISYIEDFSFSVVRWNHTINYTGFCSFSTKYNQPTVVAIVQIDCFATDVWAIDPNNQQHAISELKRYYKEIHKLTKNPLTFNAVNITKNDFL
jgi:hypothetical protein